MKHRRNARRGVLLAATATMLALAAAAAAKNAPVQGSVAGPIVEVKGDTFTLTTPANLNVPKNRSAVTVVSSTVITEQKVGTTADVKKGLCASAFGTKNGKGVVAAERVMLTHPTKGSCTTGFRPGGNRPTGNPPSGSNRPPGGGFFGGSGNVGFAVGTIESVDGSTVKVKGPRGTTAVTLSKKTAVTMTEKVGASAIEVKLCAFVRGTSSDRGATVKAESVALSHPRGGSCTGGFRRPPGP